MKIVFSDFDGTLTLNEKLGPIFFDILEYLKLKKLPLIIVSGRSASWGHFLLTHFPLEIAIMEGGGVILRKDAQRDLIHHEYMVEHGELEHLESVTKKLQKQLPEAIISADSLGRVTDRALEFRYMEPKHLHQAKEFLDQHKVNYSQSNVHLNFWCGDISKYQSVAHLLKSDFPNTQQEDCIYFGDSLNDQSMFRSFRYSVGVSNIKPFLEQMEDLPATILQGEENQGPYGVLNYLKDYLTSKRG